MTLAENESRQVGIRSVSGIIPGAQRRGIKETFNVVIARRLLDAACPRCNRGGNLKIVQDEA